MNDFTKDELEEIFDSVMSYTDPTNDPLLTKIQAMIDNYCDHEWTPNPHDLIFYCCKCGVTK